MEGSRPPVFSVRIVSIDYYIAPPIPGLGICYSSFHGGKVNEVPVIRIYGSTPAGQKTCLHVHRVLPYLYVPCSDLGSIQNDEVDSCKGSISLALEKALKLKGNAGSKRQHVHGCDIVQAKKFYGYHSSEELFLKIYLYNPHDVSRAADLLLTGAILDKTLQPYESHIPFLLQFLIDYNLYGMGLLHVAKVRFRYPVPDVFSQWKGKHQAKLRRSSDDSTQMDFQDDLGGDLCPKTPIWISSTIPEGWIGQCSPGPGSSINEDITLPRRQSTCGLEADAVVQDVINQQLISYASLSQTDSEVKMVQSLIPIWEEEYERNGVPEATPLASHGKPLPQDVLRNLSDGIEFENLVELRSEEENRPLLTPESLESSKVCGDLADVANNNDLTLNNLKASDRVGSLLLIDSPFRDADAAGTDVIDAGDELQLSGTEGPSTAKAMDEDALSLLKWLASSQAAEDINSDDELARETILSPLLPSKHIEKVLERANVDYESESQKDCQDILDSVDMLNFEKSDCKASCPEEINQSFESLLDRTIPQVDGSSDDLQPVSCQDKSEAKPHAERQSWPQSDLTLICKNRMKRPRWGSLPISRQRASGFFPPDTLCIPEGIEERKEGLGTSCPGDESKRSLIVLDDEQKGISGMKQSSAGLACSPRDLMRRKRSHRTEIFENRSQEDLKAESHPNAEYLTGYINTDSKLCNSIQDPRDGISILHKSPMKNEDAKVCHEAVHLIPTTSSIAAIGVSPMSSSKEKIEEGNLPMNRNLGDVGYDSCLGPNELELACVSKTEVVSEDDPGLFEPCGTSENLNKEYGTANLIGMTFSVKPPTINWTDEPKGEGSNIHTSIPGDIADNYLPFFSSDRVLDGASLRKCKNDGNREPVLGVPTLFQNDGSYLFMLTPAASPPSTESVDRWLSSNSSNNISEQKPNVPSPFGECAPLSGEKLDQKNGTVKVESINVNKKNVSTACSMDISQISGPDKNMRQTPLSQIGFRDPASAGQGQQLTLMSIEVQAESRGDLRPDPRFDAINIIVLVLQEDDESTFDTHVLLRGGSYYAEKDLDAVSESTVSVFTEEQELLKHFIKIVHATNPDVLMGWDVQSGSLGYLAERAAFLGVGLLNSISRTPSQINVTPGDSDASQKEMGALFSQSVTAEAVHLENTLIEDEWGRTHASGVHVGGRIVLNVWRLMRNEVKLNMYTVEAVAEAVLRRKIPYIPWKVLKQWFSSGPGRARYRSIDYTVERAKLSLQIMNQLDMINRTSELARVFGIDFFSVLSRGSQYRVESMFLRLAHTQNFLAISPGKQQVANQPAMECLPLVMEPESKFYADPVIVLDFQSLYPSMVIAYNLCFCTCLGKFTPTNLNILGVSSYSPDVNTLRNLKDDLLLTPNGVVYVPSKVRKGILPRLLEEILSTRIMVKKAMKKLAPSQVVLHRILNARQLALKLIANVTYGYTAAGFSGRMPCAELADSIVQCGRRTLESAIAYVNSNDKWKARVVYGDTDSMFVLLKGRSLREAFTIGREIASAITEINPNPVTLKMEKVYFPCFLLTKKRYVGYSYESPDQCKPAFDAKGVETVRRDTCGAVSKMMEQSLRIYFESQDIDKVREYMQRQWTRILSGRISLQDFVFAKEVRLGTYSAGAYSLPPAAIVATKSIKSDPRAEPRYAERIPYVVVHGEPGARLVDMVVEPLELLSINSPFRLNDVYYIRKQIIPALQRVFGLVGADLNQWFLDMPRPAREAIGKRYSFAQNPQRMRIDYYYESKHCILCGDLVHGSAHLCHNCCKDERTVAAALTGRTSKLEKDLQHLAAICRHCGGGDWLVESGVKCQSLACSVFYERVKVQKELMSLTEVVTKTGLYPKCMVEWF
ncbi:DNA polymerase zeta catalytic subunit [Striga hermonthica]|uniref:DNA polymerase n=1 Tax=Striga hermonthica TaxID=68872 RepID=A0A9N7MQC6_STRHE|nr:DNA polymerase zeta catalytic subunit [Striga hermonthica]